MQRTSSSQRRKLFTGIAAPFLAALLCLFLGGCGGTETIETTDLTFAGPPVLTGALGRRLDSEIRCVAAGRPTDADMSASLVSASGVIVRFRVLEQPDGAKGAAVFPAEAVSDAAGLTRTAFTVGDKPGLYRIEASVADRPDIPKAVVSVVGGVRIEGGGQDGWVGRTIDERLSVRLESAPGTPLGKGEGMVRFVMMRFPEGTTLTSQLVDTDDTGAATTEIRLGPKQGLVEVGVSILDGMPGTVALLAPIPVNFFAIDAWSVAVAMLGGLALFLFGMKMMSESLQFVAGDKLRDLLNLLTTNRFMAVGAGALVTALIQSSSACSVMVIGFVNAGLMRLEQAIGVIMGANIGTTLTAQIISLKLNRLALPALVVGVGILFVAKRQAIKYWASIIIGFGILFLGMNIMSQELGELKASAFLVSLFKGLHCEPGADGIVPLVQFLKAISCGLIVTLILQSSAATIGLLITVAGAGLIDPFAAFGILLGDNIGTTITAVLASIGTNATGKRVACSHVMFNVFGVVLMILLNYVQVPMGSGRPVFMEIANVFTAGDVFKGGENLPRFLANAHTLFNVSCTFLFIGFISVFARICRFVIKADADEEKAVDTTRRLEPHLLAMPSLALQQVWTEAGVMLEKAREAQTEGFRALMNAPTQEWNTMAKSAKNLEKETDELREAITRYLGGISLTTLNEIQSEMYPQLLRTVNEAEKVADLGKHLSKLAKRVNKRSISFSEEATKDLGAMVTLADEILVLAEKTVNINADGIEMAGGGGVLRRKLLDDGKRLGKNAKTMANTLRKNHERRHEEGLCDIKSGVVFLDVANALARSAGCALNIIEAACHIAGRQSGSIRFKSVKTKTGGM